LAQAAVTGQYKYFRNEYKVHFTAGVTPRISVHGSWQVL